MKRVAIFIVLYCISTAALLFPVTSKASSQPATNEAALTGKVSCLRCFEGFRAVPKGYTRWTWALDSVKQGDGIGFVVGKQTFTLKGDKDQLLKYMEDEATITGHLEGATLVVQTITSPNRDSR
jgi:hypothetical protein